VLSRTAAGKLLDRSEAGQQAPREDFNEFCGFLSAQAATPMDFSWMKTIVVINFIDFKQFSLILQDLACPERVPPKK